MSVLVILWTGGKLFGGCGSGGLSSDSLAPRPFATTNLGELAVGHEAREIDLHAPVIEENLAHRLLGDLVMNHQIRHVVRRACAVDQAGFKCKGAARIIVSSIMISTGTGVHDRSCYPKINDEGQRGR
jgi:hypothetical protein